MDVGNVGSITRCEVRRGSEAGDGRPHRAMQRLAVHGAEERACSLNSILRMRSWCRAAGLIVETNRTAQRGGSRKSVESKAGQGDGRVEWKGGSASSAAACRRLKGTIHAQAEQRRQATVLTNRHRCFGLRKQHRRGGDAFGAACGTRRPAGSKRTHAGEQREEFGAFRATRAQLDAAAGAAGSAGRPAAGADHPGKNTNKSAEGRGTNAEARRQLQAWAGRGPPSAKGDVQQQVWFGFLFKQTEGQVRGRDVGAMPLRTRAAAPLPTSTGM